MSFPSYMKQDNHDPQSTLSLEDVPGTTCGAFSAVPSRKLRDSGLSSYLIQPSIYSWENAEGDIVIDLLVDHAPKLCENFLKLCKVKYYNFSPVHSVQKNFSFQTGDPLGPLSKDSDGGSSIWGHVSGDPAKRTFPAFFHPKLKHLERGTVSMATAPLQSDPDTRVAGSQFIVTLGEDTDYLDGKAAIFGKVVEGFEVLDKINGAIVDEKGYPLIDIRIKHTVILDDPYPDPPGLREPSLSPPPTAQQLKTVRIEDEAALHADDNVDEEELERRRRNREAQAQALTLEMMGDLPFAEVKPPENVLFVCKLNPVTGDEDLELIFGRFGKILSCEVIRDQKTGDSLQYAFIEFEDKTSCEAAYFKMQDVLIDDRRIHVDFSQSVSKLSDVWRKDTNSKRRATAHRGGWGGVDELEKRRQYRDEGERITGDWGAVDRNRRRMMRLLQDLTMMKDQHVDEVGVGVRGQEIEVGIDIANHEMTIKANGAIEIMIETDIGTVATIVETEVKKGIDLDGTIMIAGQGDKEDCTGVLGRNTIDGKRSALLCYATASANFNTECIVRHYTKMEYPHNTSLTATLKENLVAEFNALLRDMQTPTSSHLTYGPSPEYLLQATEDNVDCSVEHTLNTVSFGRSADHNAQQGPPRHNMFGFTSKYCILYEPAGCLSFSRTLQNLSLLLYLWIKNPSFSAMPASPVPSRDTGGHNFQLINARHTGVRPPCSHHIEDYVTPQVRLVTVELGLIRQASSLKLCSGLRDAAAAQGTQMDQHGCLRSPMSSVLVTMTGDVWLYYAEVLRYLSTTRATGFEDQ
ncbi:hypothetical protein DER46DRAFT_627442 [Fusarium sp. MPI-SDFR-AT-0072]|nr:hypothetical protein DER46DRAFT_627442 [Fusarium sp. MPI-SDFR-AT-0072]